MEDLLSQGISSGAPLADHTQWRAQDYSRTYYSEGVRPDEIPSSGGRSPSSVA
jgi:hypothetical protein